MMEIYLKQDDSRKKLMSLEEKIGYLEEKEMERQMILEKERIKEKERVRKREIIELIRKKTKKDQEMESIREQLMRLQNGIGEEKENDETSSPSCIPIDLSSNLPSFLSSSLASSKNYPYFPNLVGLSSSNVNAKDSSNNLLKDYSGLQSHLSSTSLLTLPFSNKFNLNPNSSIVKNSFNNLNFENSVFLDNTPPIPKICYSSDGSYLNSSSQSSINFVPLFNSDDIENDSFNSNNNINPISDSNAIV
jgi:hypothetical protein